MCLLCARKLQSGRATTEDSLRARMTGLAGEGGREAGDQIPPGTPEALSRCSLSIFIYLAVPTSYTTIGFSGIIVP